MTNREATTREKNALLLLFVMVVLVWLYQLGLLWWGVLVPEWMLLLAFCILLLSPVLHFFGVIISLSRFRRYRARWLYLLVLYLVLAIGYLVGFVGGFFWLVDFTTPNR